ncbi:MAG: hypothetical protein LRY51_05440, partial [Geovibrio sp.]|nr:hypothetical protein [Geovibrio sp.]
LIISPVFNFRGAYRQIVLVDDNYPVEHTGEYDPGSGEPITTTLINMKKKRGMFPTPLTALWRGCSPFKGKQKGDF